MVHVTSDTSLILTQLFAVSAIILTEINPKSGNRILFWILSFMWCFYDLVQRYVS